MKTTPQNISKEDALRAYAKMMHHLSVDYLEPLLADDFHYASQWVFEEITSKQQFLDYMRPKLETSGSPAHGFGRSLASCRLIQVGRV